MHCQQHIPCTRILVVLALLSCTCGRAQMRDFRYKFIARVVDADSMRNIPGCHIINKTQRMGTVSDEYGAFTITANVRDSLEFSAIGFAKLRIAVHDSMYSNNRIIRLVPVAYELSQVDIGLLSTYERFRRDMMNKKSDSPMFISPISRFEVYIPPLPNQGGINVPFAASPITFLYNLWSKEGKQLRHYQSIINKTADFIIIGEKFNGLLVNNLTGLRDDELINFMASCNFSNDYLLSASEVDIQRAIMRNYRDYRRKRKH